jgi:hypothetical protein
MTGKISGVFRQAALPGDFARLGLDAANIAPWEDGQRLSVKRGTYEWWYFDAHLDDGATVVVVFYTKPPLKPDGLLDPTITINLTRPDGTIIDKTLSVPRAAYSASAAGCDVRIGDNSFVGDLHRYRIQARIDNVQVDVTLTGDVPPWRPHTGHSYFESGKTSHFFAWLPSVPQGQVDVTYQVGSEVHHSRGIGYHDHNWGNAPMHKLMHDWYWARAKIGPYTTVAAYITAEQQYGYQDVTVYLLARDGAIVADDEASVTFKTDDVFTDPVSGKPVANITRYTYKGSDADYVITFTREQTILCEIFTHKLSWAKRLLATLAGFDGAYHRFSGTARLQKIVGGTVVEDHQDQAIWELMYFGKARAPAV